MFLLMIKNLLLHHQRGWMLSNRRIIMIDPNQIRNNLEEVVAQWEKRGLKVDIAKLREMEEVRKELQVKTQHLQSQRNAISKAIGHAKAKKEDASSLMAEVEKATKDL